MGDLQWCQGMPVGSLLWCQGVQGGGGGCSLLWCQEVQQGVSAVMSGSTVVNCDVREYSGK